MFSSLLHSLLLVSLCSLCLAINLHWEASGSIPVHQAASIYALFVIEYLFIIYSYARTEARGPIYALVAASIIGRVILAFAPVLLTGDLPRYLWEGMLVREGMNPFFYAPNDPALQSLRTEYWPSIEYAHLSAIYPPVAQYFLGMFARSVIVWKLFLAFVEAVNIYLLFRLLKEFSVPRGMVLVYACLPLAMFESCLSGHLETIVVTFLIAFFLYIRSLELRAFFVYKDTIPAPAMLALALLSAAAIFTKYVLALPLLVFLLLRGKHFGLLRFSFFSCSFVLFSFLICAPFLKVNGELVPLFQSLSTYLTHWRFNDSVFHLLGFLLGVNWNDTTSFWYIKVALLCLWPCVLFLYLKNARNSVRPTLFGFVFFLLLAAVFHPWYALWFAPLVAVELSAAPLYLLLSVPLSYVVKTDGFGVDPPNIVKLIEFIPFFLFLLWGSKISFTPKTRSRFN